MDLQKDYVSAKELYKKWDIDTDAAIKAMSKLKISINCWQGDDGEGFEKNRMALSGGIQATGNYPGKARNGDELRSDLEKALSLIPGKHQINLHSIYAETGDEIVERNEFRPEHYTKWVEWAKELGLGLNFNPTNYAHKYASDGLTLSHPDEKIRKFWIEHCIACRKIGEYFGRELGQTCLTNLWIPDGYKDMPSDRIGPRARLKDSLDQIFADPIDPKYNLDSVESKVFGIGVESYTVGSHEFYMKYTAGKPLLCLLDMGHFHPTEVVADKLSSMLLFDEKLALHVTRNVRWDSDHVVALNDDLDELCKEIIRCDALDRIIIGLDFFDASINRVAAWVIGTRNVQKALLRAMLMPHKYLKELQDKGDFTHRLALMEEFKMYPCTAVWDEFCRVNNVPLHEDWIKEVDEYEQNVQLKRV